jgi:hypothetical protein
MEAILKFNLPEDQAELNSALDGYKWELALRKLDQYLRTNTKYAPDSFHDEKVKALYETRDELHRIMNSYNLEFE